MGWYSLTKHGPICYKSRLDMIHTYPSRHVRLSDELPRPRRSFLQTIGLISVLTASCTTPARQERRPTVSMAPFDEAMQDFMAARKIPGGALTVIQDSRLIHARGYGLADRTERRPVSQASLFRIASLSKPITAAAILLLVQERRLDLDQYLLNLPGFPWTASGSRQAMNDDRFSRVTVRHLLQHTGGWDHAGGSDPMFQSKQVAAAFSVPTPPTLGQVIEFVLRQPLAFEPGTRYAYSNFGYALLGRIVAAVSGLPYQVYVRRYLLEPAGIRQMSLGRSSPNDRFSDEVHYYTAEEAQCENVMDPTGPPVPVPYGGFCLELMDAHGGWVASVVDFARFLAALDDPRQPLLQPRYKAAMFAPPPAPVWRTEAGCLKDHYYACGWLVRPIHADGAINVWHAGSLPGTFALAVRRWDGLAWVALFNQRSDDPRLPNDQIDPALHRAAAAVCRWPHHDLFRNL